jgi:uncharacterized protein (TIGR03790 family)
MPTQLAKPVSPRLNPAHPLAQSLVGAYLHGPSTGPAGLVRDLSPIGRHLTLNAHPWSPAATPFGPGINRSSAAGSLASTSRSITLSQATLITCQMASWSYWHGPCNLLYFDASGSQPRTNDLFFTLTPYAPSPTGVCITSSFHNAGDPAAFRTIAASLTPTGTGSFILVDGIAQPVATVGSFPVSSASTLSLASSSFAGRHAFLLLFNRALSIEQVRALLADPFEMFRPRAARRLIPLGLAAVPPPLPSVTLEQSPLAAYPDRPFHATGQVGAGLRATLSAGPRGRYLAKDLTAPRTILHTRIALNLTQLTGGWATVLRGLDESLAQTFRLDVDPIDHLARLHVGSSQLTAPLTPNLTWHTLEVRLDDAANSATLWVNGQQAATASSLTLSPTRHAWVGSPFKHPDAVGLIDFDEWVLSDAYIGPVTLTPTLPHADDPARWLVIYNRSVPDSVTWAQWFAAQRRIPLANLLGLDLPTTEHITLAQFTNLRAAIDTHLALNDPHNHILGLVLGHAVPGSFENAGLAESIPAALHYSPDAAFTPIPNPLATTDPTQLTRPTATNLASFRLVTRIDGPTLAASQSLTTRALALSAAPLTSADAIYLDAAAPDDLLHQPIQQALLDWSQSLHRQALRMTLHVTTPGAPGSDTQFATLENDAFFWGLRQPEVSSAFFASGSSAGPRVAAVQLAFDSATLPTVRQPGHTGWGVAPIEAGYAAVGATTRPFTTSVPAAPVFFESLRRGHTIAEAWFLSLTGLRQGLTLLADPFLTITPPAAGYNLHGPFPSIHHLAAASLNTPAAMLRADESSLHLTGSLAPVDHAANLYLLRRVDDHGRIDTSSTLLAVHRLGPSLSPIPSPPLWPTALWRAVISPDDPLNHTIDTAFPDRFAALGITTLQLLRQSTSGSAFLTLATATPDPRSHRHRFTVPVPAESVRYMIRALSSANVAIDSPVSDWHHPTAPAPLTLQFL